MPRKRRDPASLEAEVLRLKAKLKDAEARTAEAAEDDVLPDPDYPGTSKVEEIVKALSETGTVDIYRLDAGKKIKMGTYDFSSVAEWESAIEAVLKVKGGGDYLCIFREADGRQVGQVQRTFDRDMYKPEPLAQASASPATPGFDFAKLLELQASRDAEHRRDLEAMRLEMARQSQESMRLMVEMVKGSQASPLKSIQDFALVKKLFSDDKDPIERMLDLRDLMDEFKGQASRENESPIVRAIERFAEGLASKRPAPPAPRASLPNPAPSPAPAKKSDAPVSPAPVERPSLGAYAEMFKAAIEGGHAPEVAAVAVYERTAADKRPELQAHLNGDWDALAASDAYLSEHKAWLVAFRSKLAALFSMPAGVSA
ncbi:MAG: hypothetical protein KGO96_13675 [Elusimicrobia bacterium]|nr:hypothetical protein [Elusimicrobiota bacterium]MDE2236262.1 hypothetical protein [Elusimicrobiota bacterium]MDE2426944.1 hypothetical protein [Elusimicrobiota bacterium]